MQIIYNNNEYELKPTFPINNNQLEIILKGVLNVIDMHAMFKNCKNLIKYPDIHLINTNNVIYIFKWNTNDVKDMMYMFKDCSSLKSLPDISK